MSHTVWTPLFRPNDIHTTTDPPPWPAWACLDNHDEGEEPYQFYTTFETSVWKITRVTLRYACEVCLWEWTNYSWHLRYQHNTLVERKEADALCESIRLDLTRYAVASRL